MRRHALKTLELLCSENRAIWPADRSRSSVSYTSSMCVKCARQRSPDDANMKKQTEHLQCTSKQTHRRQKYEYKTKCTKAPEDHSSQSSSRVSGIGEQKNRRAKGRRDEARVAILDFKINTAPRVEPVRASRPDGTHLHIMAPDLT